MQEQFDINRIIGIRIVDKQVTSHRFLPKKQKTTFFGLIKLNSWHSEGFYSNGHYEECYECGCWDGYSYTAQQLREGGYLVDTYHDKVYNKPYVTVYLESDYQTTRKFDTIEQAKEWVDELKATSGKTFEIVNK